MDVDVDVDVDVWCVGNLNCSVGDDMLACFGDAFGVRVRVSVCDDEVDCSVVAL